MDNCVEITGGCRQYNYCLLVLCFCLLISCRAPLQAKKRNKKSPFLGKLRSGSRPHNILHFPIFCPTQFSAALRCSVARSAKTRSRRSGGGTRGNPASQTQSQLPAGGQEAAAGLEARELASMRMRAPLGRLGEGEEREEGVRLRVPVGRPCITWWGRRRRSRFLGRAIEKRKGAREGKRGREEGNERGGGRSLFWRSWERCRPLKWGVRTVLCRFSCRGRSQLPVEVPDQAPSASPLDRCAAVNPWGGGSSGRWCCWEC